MTEWFKKWTTLEHYNSKVKMFNILDRYINSTPMSILDIGCGLAFESEMFQKKYNSNLFLLDGDFDNTKDEERDIEYGTVETFKFYNKLDTLKESFNKRNLKYTFVDATDIQLDDNIKFDLVYSIMSCGFHYPLNTYAELIKNHTTSNSKIIIDIRNSTLKDQDCEFEIVDKVYSGKKHTTYQIKFL